MPPRGRNRRPKRGLSGAFIVMGIMSLLYSGVFPLFRLFDYAVLALVMLGAGKIYRAVVKKIHQKEDEAAEEEERRERQREEYARKRREAEEKRKAEQAKATTGDAAVDSLILRGQQLAEQAAARQHQKSCRDRLQRGGQSPEHGVACRGSEIRAHSRRPKRQHTHRRECQRHMLR